MPIRTRPKPLWARGCLSLLVVLAVAAIVATALVYFQGVRKPSGRAQYVALGSSFAAGSGLGPRAADTPFLCGRGSDNYPRQVARATHLDLTDVSCGGATSAHVLRGGQLFQHAQLDALGNQTELVTLTIGGNDVGYVGDLMGLAARGSTSWTGSAARLVGGTPKALAQRDFAGVRRDIAAIVTETARRAPRARIFVLTYPAILPRSGTCARLGLTEAEVAAMRIVSDKLASVTRAAAKASGATVIPIDRLSIGHGACAPIPWTNGWIGADTTAFHPTAAGAKAMAAAVIDAYRRR